MPNAFTDRLSGYAALNNAELVLLTEACRNIRELPAGHHLMVEGDKPDPVFVMLEGWACGYTWRKGVLTFKGKTYPFEVDGLSAVGIGVTKISGTGTIYHLKSVADFAGTHATAGGGGSIGSKGQSSASMRNDKGVVMEFKAKEKGVSVNLDLGGVHIKMMPK